MCLKREHTKNPILYVRIHGGSGMSVRYHSFFVVVVLLRMGEEVLNGVFWLLRASC